MGIFEPAVKKYFGILEGFAAISNGFLLHSGVTYVDFQLSYYYEMLNSVHPELMKLYSHVQGIVQRVNALPRLEMYLEQRPKTVW